MSKPLIKIHNTESGEVIEREMNDAEFAQYQIDQSNSDVRQEKIEAQAEAKAAAEGKLAALGLTTDDLRALGL